MLFSEDMIAFISMLEVLLIFFVNMNFYFESFGSEHSCHNKENYIEIYAISFHIKNSIFIIYLLEDEQELSLGMLDTSPTYL